MPNDPNAFHSSNVSIWLDCGEHGCVELSRVTPTKVVFRHPASIPAGRAELVVSVDGVVQRRPVEIADRRWDSDTVATVFTIDNVAPF